MAADPAYDALVADLRTLGRALPDPAPGPDTATTVLARLEDLPPPRVPGAARRLAGRAVAGHRRRVVAVLAALALGLAATPPVRAAVADWFGFAGVEVRSAPAQGPTSAPPPPGVEGAADLERAVRSVGFAVLVPAALGRPQGVEVSADRRVLSMSWTGSADGTLRLDQFDGRLDYTFAKSAPGVEFTAVGDAPALWFDSPHEVVVLDPDGSSRTETARLAGHTLIWERGRTTLRLEGDIDLDRAREIAATAATVP